MSVDTATSTRPQRGLLLVLGLIAALLSAGCGNENKAEPKTESTTERAPQLIRVHYSTPVDPDGESYGVEMDIIALGAEKSRTKVAWFVDDGPADENVLVIRNGNRALVYDDQARPRYAVLEAADEQPDYFPIESSPLEPGSDTFQQLCPDAQPAGSRTILDRAAVGYTCTGEKPDPAMPNKIWLDKATGRLLENGSTKATEFVVDPEIDENTFSTTPPAGVKFSVVKATGKGPPTPESEEPELNPEDALATIASTSPIPIYYLGPEFEGMPLSDVVIYDDVSGSDVPGDLRLDAGQTVWIWYGEEFQMNTTRFVPDHYRKAAGCSRLQPLRGVPTVEQADAVSLITADLVIWLGVVNPRQAAPAADALIAVGEEPTGADLPAPPAGNLALVDKACGANPGDHGRRIED